MAKRSSYKRSKTSLSFSTQEPTNVNPEDMPDPTTDNVPRDIEAIKTKQLAENAVEETADKVNEGEENATPQKVVHFPAKKDKTPKPKKAKEGKGSSSQGSGTAQGFYKTFKKKGSHTYSIYLEKLEVGLFDGVIERLRIVFKSAKELKLGREVKKSPTVKDNEVVKLALPLLDVSLPFLQPDEVLSRPRYGDDTYQTYFQNNQIAVFNAMLRAVKSAAKKKGLKKLDDIDSLEINDFEMQVEAKALLGLK